jgi:DNA topoisomerase-1
VSDPDVLARIAALAIPPAWQEVWICPWPHGHIQAVGTDAAGRRQYRYHDSWHVQRDREKFTRMLEFGRALPALRKVVTQDLGRRGLGQRRVLAVGARLLDIGCFRIGNAEYAEEHETFGIASLRNEHVTVRGPEVHFTYAAKGSIERTVTVTDREVRRAVVALQRRRNRDDELLTRKVKGGWMNVSASDINDYIKVEAGEQFSAKDFRTWSGTVHAAIALAKVHTDVSSPSSRKRAAAAAMKEVAEYLGNTPAVCRSAYVDPRLLDRFDAGDTIAPPPERLRGEEDRFALQVAAEGSVLRLLGEDASAAA